MTALNACIIGAASGIGEATARELAARGYTIFASDRDSSRLVPLVETTGASTHALDLTDVAAVDDYAQTLPDLDALVVTAGLSPSMADFERIIEVNLCATASAVTRLSACLRPGGAIICIASMTAHTLPAPSPSVIGMLDTPDEPGIAGRIAAAVGAESTVPGLGYALSKFAVLRLVRRLAAPMGGRGLRICSVSPGCIDTPMGQLEMGRSPASREALSHAPIPRSGTPEEVAKVIAFLVSPDAGYITGCDLQVDGGWVGASLAGSDGALITANTAGRNKT
jgi:NAD(P)-dependent dehydrogenase (short-subunit alcohol dehydrogenase family)